MPNFPPFGRSAGARLPKRRLAAPPSRTRWSRGPTTASASSRCAARSPMLRRAPRAAIRCRRGSSCSASTIPIRSAPTGRRWRTSTQGATGLALVFEGAPNAFGYGLPANAGIAGDRAHNMPLNRVHICASTCIRQAAPASTGWSRCLTSGAPIRQSSACPSASTRRRSSPAPAGCACRSRRCRRRCRNRWRISSRSALPGILLEGDGRVFHNAGATEAQELGIALASAVSHLRMFEEARQALVYAAPHIGFSLGVDQDQFLSMAKLRALRTAVGARAGSLLDPAVGGRHPCRDVLPHDDAPGPGNQHPAHDDRLLRGRCRRRRFDLDPAAHASRTACPTRFARRIARNTQLDPGQGKPYRLRRRSGRRFGQRRGADRRAVRSGLGRIPAIEKEGGILDSLAAGKVQSPHRRGPRRSAPRTIAKASARSSARRSIR